LSEKRWLIRTRSKQILGPASKEKIISLLEKSSLSDDDELTSGNGYWFWVKEKALVDKYLYEGAKQGFNPISEAETKLGSIEKEDIEKPLVLDVSNQSMAPHVSTINTDEAIFPNEEELAFPEVVSISDEDLISDNEVIQDDEEIEDETLTSITEMPISDDDTVSLQDDDCDQTSVFENTEKSSEGIEIGEEDTSEEKKSVSTLRYLLIFLMVLVIFVVTLFFYYRTVLGRPVPFIGMNDAHAQSMNSLVKKKLLLS